MYKINLIFILFYLLLSCSQTSQSNDISDSKGGIATFCIEKATQKEFELAESNYQSKLDRDTSNIRKQNGILRIPLTSNTYKIFQDKIKGEEDEDRIEYNYLGQFKSADLYGVSIAYWEDIDVLLVDKKTGETYTLWSVPYLSPNNTKFANILSYGLEGAPVGIQIWSVTTDPYQKVNKIIEINQELWNPIDFVWENDNSLILKVSDFPDFSKENHALENISYLRISLN